MAARGGRDQFSWENVKSDKYKENYLGHTTKIKPMWWGDVTSKGSKMATGPASKASMESERLALKKQEEAMMLEALGLKPQQQRLSGKSMEQHEIDELCKRGNIAEEERDMFSKGEMRVAGLGFAPAPTHREIVPHLKNMEPQTPSGTGSSIFDRPNMVQGGEGEGKGEGKDKGDKRSRDDGDDHGDKKRKKDKHKKDKKDKKEKKEKKEKKKEKKEKRDKEDRRDRDKSERSDRDRNDRDRSDRGRSDRSDRDRSDRDRSDRSDRDRNDRGRSDRDRSDRHDR